MGEARSFRKMDSLEEVLDDLLATDLRRFSLSELDNFCETAASMVAELPTLSLKFEFANRFNRKLFDEGERRKGATRRQAWRLCVMLGGALVLGMLWGAAAMLLWCH